MKKNLIAPCGMNCAVCSGYLREKNKCPGCQNNPTISYCQRCKIKLCEKRAGSFCFDCKEFPCAKLKQLDKRYREKYEMSEIENLQFIKEKGMTEFLKQEEKRWVNSEGIYCVHNKNRY